jgi:hypothetical protein
MDPGKIHRVSFGGLEVVLNQRLGVHSERPVLPRPEKDQHDETQQDETPDRDPSQGMDVTTQDPVAQERRGNGRASNQDACGVISAQSPRAPAHQEHAWPRRRRAHTPGDRP